MKYLILFLLICTSTCIFGQETTFYDENMKKVKTLEESVYYETVKVDSVGSTGAWVRLYYKSGKLKSEQRVFYKDGKGRFNGGEIKEWYENGQLSKQYYYSTAISLDGEALTYYKNGKVKRKDLFKEGKLIEGHTFSIDGIEVPYSSFIINASFPGGNDEMVSFIGKNLNYPKKAKKNNVEGTVEVLFCVEANGELDDISIVKPVDDNLEKEAIRLIKKMPNWSPYIIDGEVKASYFVLPVTFRLLDN